MGVDLIDSPTGVYWDTPRSAALSFPRKNVMINTILLYSNKEIWPTLIVCCSFECCMYVLGLPTGRKSTAWPAAVSLTGLRESL